MKSKITLSGLRKFNLIMGCLHLGQGILILFLSRIFTLPVNGSYLKFDATSKSLIPVNTHLFGLSLPLIIAIFLLLSATAHFVISTIYNKQYNKDIVIGINKARWFEYSISASLMMVAISMLVGVYDFMSLLMIFGFIFVMNMMGLVMEIHNQTTKKVNWISFSIGCVAGVVPWLVIAFYLWIGAVNGSNAPSFVYWIYVSIFLFFNCFAINMFLQYKKIGPWKDYIYGERVYIILSLVAKTLLAWQVFFGTLRP